MIPVQRLLLFLSLAAVLTAVTEAQNCAPGLTRNEINRSVPDIHDWRVTSLKIPIDRLPKYWVVAPRGPGYPALKCGDVLKILKPGSSTGDFGLVSVVGFNPCTAASCNGLSVDPQFADDLGIRHNVFTAVCWQRINSPP